MNTCGGLSRREMLGSMAAMGAAVALGARPCVAAESQAAAGWRIGCFTRPFVDLEYRAAFDAVAEAGYKYVGFMTVKASGGTGKRKGGSEYIITPETSVEDAAKAGEEAKKRGLGVLAAWGGGLPAVQKSVEAGVASLKRLIDNAEAAGVPTLLMGGTGEKTYDAYYRAIKECCEYAAEKHVALVIKPHGGLNANGEQCRKTIEKVGNKNFRVWYDPGNIFFYSDGKLDPVDDAEKVAGIVTGMCVKDFKPPKDVNVTPGEGKVNFPKVMEVLKRGGFNGGPLVVETIGPAEGLAGKIAEARKARELVERLVGKA